MWWFKTTRTLAGAKTKRTLVVLRRWWRGGGGHDGDEMMMWRGDRDEGDEVMVGVVEMTWGNDDFGSEVGW
ncbi:hypothetical protein Tco_0949051 [Tanacetum coccineum]